VVEPKVYSPVHGGILADGKM